MSSKPDEGRGRCPYDPYQRNTAIIVGKVVMSQLLYEEGGAVMFISRSSMRTLITGLRSSHLRLFEPGLTPSFHECSYSTSALVFLCVVTS